MTSNNDNGMFINSYVTIMIIKIIMTTPMTMTMTMMMTMTILITTMTIITMTKVLVTDGHNKLAMRRTRIAQQHVTNKKQQ